MMNEKKDVCLGPAFFFIAMAQDAPCDFQGSGYAMPSFGSARKEERGRGDLHRWKGSNRAS
jgi:hypothetical protein